MSRERRDQMDEVFAVMCALATQIRLAIGPWRVGSGQQAGGTESAFLSQADCHFVASGMCVFASLSCSCLRLVVFLRMFMIFT